MDKLTKEFNATPKLLHEEFHPSPNELHMSIT